MLPIVEMFESIQGEGSMTGTPSFFIRLAGCNLKCLHPDSLITMGDFSQKPIRKLKPGDEVLGVEHKHPNNQYVVKQRVKRVWTKEGVAIKISFPSGNLTCSEDHRIYSFRRHGYAYAKNVNNANLAVLPKSNTIEDNEYKEGYLQGSFYGDGWVGSYLSFVVKDFEFAERVCRFLNDLFPNKKATLSPKRCRQGNYWRVHSKNKEIVERYRKNLTLLETHFEDSSFFRGFCAGFFDAEGSWNGGRNGIVISQTQDRDFLEVITRKLSSFNAILKETKSKICSSGRVFKINICSNKNALAFAVWANPALTRKLRFDCRVLNKEKASVSTVPCYEGVLYEIETEKGNYFAENVLVHNCEWCDTDHREQYKLHPEMLLEMLQESRMTHVVVTGGEPTIHDELPLIVTEIIKTGKTVQIETNGKLPQPIFNDPDTFVTVSPKTPEFQRRRGQELKVVWNPAIWTEISLEHLISTTDFKYYYLQPLWRGADSNIDQVIKQLLDNPLWRLSLQTHKYIGVR